MSTLALPIYLTGDINLPLIKPEDAVSKHFNVLISSYGLVQCVTGPTHDDQDGLLDVVITIIIKSIKYRSDTLFSAGTI